GRHWGPVGAVASGAWRCRCDALIESAKRPRAQSFWLARSLRAVALSVMAKLLTTVRQALRARHFAQRTEEIYVGWVRRYVKFHNRHPRELRGREINALLTDLAVTRHVSSATQDQATAALLFLYRDVLELPYAVGGVGAAIVRAQRPKRLPVVLTPAEVGRV